MFRKSLVLAVFLLTGSLANASDYSLEPCINGDVSTTGNFPSQEMEDQVYAYLEWRSHQPYYLFRIASEDIEKTLFWKVD